MRLLHTSDWHLGRGLHGESLLAAQALVLEHLSEVVRDEHVDAVLIAGDIYDRAMPPLEAVTLLNRALLAFVDAGAQVIISSGNHDSATRLGFGAELMAKSGVHIRSSLTALADPVVLGDTAIYALPYLDPSSVTLVEALGASASTHTAVLAAAMDRVRADVSSRPEHAIVMAHCFVGSGVGSDSERDISQGGVGLVPAEVFDGVAYAALGHLHRRQQITPTVRYCGSPVAMSFSEAGYTKGYDLLEVREGEVEVTFIEAPLLRPLARLRGSLEEILESPEHVEAEGAWVQVTLTDAIRPVGAMQQLRARFPHLLNLEFAPEGAPVTVTSYRAALAAKTPHEVCLDFVTTVRAGADATPDEADLLGQALRGGARLRSLREETAGEHLVDSALDDSEGSAAGAAGDRTGAA